MDKKTKKIACIVVALILIVLIIIFVSVTLGNKGVTKQDETTISNQESLSSKDQTQETAVNVEGQSQKNENKDNKDKTTKSDGEIVTVEEITEKATKKSKDPFEDIEVYEETKKKGDDKGQEQEAYPGEKDGWSPIVSPDDLEQ